MIKKAQDFDFESIGFLRPVYNKEKDHTVIPIYCGKRKTCLIQLPSLKLNDIPKTKLILPLTGKTSKTTLIAKTFFDTLDSFIVKNIKFLIKKDLLKKNQKNISYNPVVKELEDDDSVYKNGVVVFDFDVASTKIYECQSKELQKDISLLQKGVFIKSIIELQSIVIRNDSTIDVIINPIQLRIEDEQIDKIELTEYSFRDSDSDVDDDKDHKNDDDNELEFNDLHNEVSYDDDDDADDDDNDDDDDDNFCGSIIAEEV